MGKDLTWERYRAQIEKLAALEYNYDAKIYLQSKDRQGWSIDRYRTILAKEPPGEPVPEGPYSVAKEAINLYRFPDPRLIRAVFDPAGELAGRNMLMFARFLGLEFRFGVRVTAVTDEVRRTERGENIRVWGYAYRTLRGHFEVGEIRFLIDKNLATGEVGFEIDAYSKADRIPNFFYRAGFKVFGRSLQKYFARSSMQRLQRLAKEALGRMSANDLH